MKSRMSGPVSDGRERHGIAITAAAFIVIASMVVAMVAFSAVPTTETALRTATINPSTSLEFAMSLNSTTAQQGQTIAVSFNLYNTLDKVSNVTGAGDWRLSNASENGGVGGWNCAANDVFRIEVISGSYGLSDFSKGTPLDVFVFQPPFGFNQCLFYVRSANWTAPVLSVPPQNQNFYIFGPQSNVAWWVSSSGLGAPCLPGNGTYHPCSRPGQEATMNETMILKTGQFANSTGVFTVIGGDEWGDLEVMHFYVGPSTIQTTSSSMVLATGPTYTINGLTCHVPADYQSNPSVLQLFPLVTTNPRFLNLTSGMPFVFGNAENITDRVQQIGNQPPVHLPDALEMVFYSSGPGTSCSMYFGKSEATIDVQVPIQSGAYNMTGATFNGLTG